MAPALLPGELLLVERLTSLGDRRVAGRSCSPPTRGNRAGSS